MATSNQVKRVPNPSGKGGFQERPQDRNPGPWKVEDSISHQYHRLMRMPYDELENFKAETVAQQIAYKRIRAALTDKGLFDTKEITDRTEGKAPQSMDITSGGEKLQGAVIEFVTKPEAKDTDTDLS